MEPINKNDIINEVITRMGNTLDKDEREQLKTVLLVTLKDYNLIANETLPSVAVKDNQWLMERFMIDMIAAGLEESTIRQYVYIVRKFFDYTGLNYCDVTGQHVTDYLAIRQYKDHISQSYKATIRRYLNVFFQWGYRKHHIDIDVMRDVDSVKFERKKKERLTDDEVARCRYAAQNDLRAAALLELMLATGMRVGEIQNLQIEDLDFSKEEIRIWGEKTNTERFGYMNAECKMALQRYIGDRNTGPVFVRKRCNIGISSSILETIAKDIAARANCHVIATVHIYRKTFASITYRRTNDVLLVSRLLGHADTEITTKYYLIDDVDNMKHKMKMAA